MAKIKITSDDSVLAGLRRQLKAAQDEFLRLKASGTASADALKAAGQKVTQFGSQLNQARQEVNKLANATKGLSGFQKLEIGENLSSIFRGAQAATQQVIALGKAFYDIIQQGADFEIIVESFEKIGGTNADRELLDIAAAGNLSQRELLKFAISMKQIGLSVQSTTEFLRMIEIQSDNTAHSFEDSNEAVKSFIATGATKSLKGFLDIAGLKDEVKSLDEAWKSSHGELTEEQQELNRTNAIFNALKKSVGDTSNITKDNADKVKSLSSQYENMKDEIGLAISEGFVPYLKENKNLIRDTVDAAKSVIDFVLTLQKIGGAIKFAVDHLTSFKNTFTLIRDEVQLAIDKTKELFGLKRPKEEQASETSIRIKTLDERVKEKIDFIQSHTVPEISITSDQKEKTKGGSRSRGTEKIIEITNDIIDAQKRLADLEDKKATFSSKQLQNTLAYYKLLLQIQDVNEQISGLQLPLSARDITATVGDITATVGTLGLSGQRQPIAFDETFIPGEKKQTIQETRDELISAFQTASGSLQNMLNILNIGTDSFISKMITGFNDVLSIIQGIVTFLQAINTGAGLVKTVLGIVTGGAVGNLPALNGGVSSNSININLTGRLVGDGGQLVGVINHTNIRNARRSLGTA